MFKAKKTRPFTSQKSQSLTSESTNTENESENIPLGQGHTFQVPTTSTQDEDLFIEPSQQHTFSFHEMRSQRNERRRFMSQRSQMRYTISQSQIMASSKRVPKSYFESVLIKTGVDFDCDFYLLNCDVFRYRNLFEDALHKADDFPDNITILVNDVKKLLGNPDEWRKLLATIRFTMPGSNENADTIVNESIGNSMLRFLIQDMHLQRPMFDVFFQEIRKRTKPENENELLDFVMVINQMRFVDFRDNSDYIFNEYFSILPACNQRAREVLIGGLDDFVELAKHSAAMEKIMEQIPDSEELFTVQNLKHFGNLCVTTATLNKVRAKVIHYIKNGAPKTLLKNLLVFMAKFNEEEKETYHEVINDIRNCIEWDMEDTEIKKGLFEFVGRVINRCEVTRKSWVKAISYVGNARDHKIVDPIACFMIGSNEDECVSIESFFKKRVKEKLFTIDLIQQMARHASGILPEYITVMTDIFKACFCERDKYTAFFGSIGFRVLFNMQISQKDNRYPHRYPLQKLISLACTRPNDLPFLADNDFRTNSLELLLEIKRKLKSQADGGFAQVEKILDRSSYMSIDQYRILIKILCSLAYDGVGSSKIKTDLEIMAPKHVTNMHLRIKLQGVIIIFQILNQTMWTETPTNDDSTQCSDSSCSTISLSQIPIDSDLSNAKLLKLCLKASEHNLDALMLYYDELASIVSPRNKSMTYGLNFKFVKWLYDQILSNVQDTFVVIECPQTVQEVEMEYCFNINTPNDEEEVNTDALNIGMNIGGIVFGKVNAPPTTSIQLMCPMFNALSSMTYRRYNTSLETISALLGCSIVLPKGFSDEEKFLEEHGVHAIDIYFHVANWFRCVISSFATQGARSLKKKVLQRINQLIEVEASVKYLLQKGDPTYEPPATTYQTRDDFMFLKPIGVPKRGRKPVPSDDEDGDEDQAGPSKKKQRSKKKALPADVITQFDEESMNLNLNATTGNLAVQTQFNVQTQGTQSVEVVKHRAKYWFSYGPREKYRQLDIDIMIFLEEKLEIVYPVPEEDVGNCLYLQELKFVLADLISKTESIAGVKKFRSEQQTQNLVSAPAFIHDLVLSLKYVIGFKKQLSTYIREKICEMDTDDTAVKFSDLLNHVKICFGSCLHLLAALFSWPSFCIDDYHEMLRAAMNSILETNTVEEEGSEETYVIEELAEKTLDKIVGDETAVMDLRSAVHLLHLVKALAIYADKSEAVVSISEKLLKREWFHLDGTKECNKNADILLTEILKCYMRDMELEKLEEILEVFAEEMVSLKTKGDSMPTYPNFNRSNCTIFYRVIASTCEQTMKHCVATVVRTQELLECWKRCFDVLQVLLVINEKNLILTNTSTFLRYSHSIMKIFRSNGVKVMEKMVHRNQQSVQDLLRSMQKTSRFLHNLSCDTKAKGNSRILKQVPKLRETMEKLVLEVKSTLAGNHALSGFWVSNLMNKNVHGDVLLSQLEAEEDNDMEEPEIEDDIDSPSEVEDNEEEMSTPSMVLSRSSKVFD